LSLRRLLWIRRDMSFLRLSGKKILIAGVSNKKSIATFIAQTLLSEGVELILTTQNESQKEFAQATFPNAQVIVCDVSKKDDLIELKKMIKDQKLHGLVHSLAFGQFDLERPLFHQTKREHFLEATQISAFSLVELTETLIDHFETESSIVSLSISNTKATAYGYLGPIKAMLDAITPFLAKSVSAKKIRVNAVGAGPLKTSASAGIPNYIDNYLYAEALTLRKESLKTQEVADVVSFLLSPRSTGINAQTICVDAGMSSNYFDQEIVQSFIKGQN